MALDVGTLVAYLKVDDSHLDKGLAQAERKMEGTSKKSAALWGAAAGAAAAGLTMVAGRAVGFLSDAIGGASDLQETLSKTGVVFGSNAADITAWAKTSATSFGLSQQAALAAATQFGDMFQQIGFTGAEATKNSKSIVQMAADLGSFHNVDPTDVLDRISAAMRGEYDSLQALIPNINAARVEQEALAMTGKTTAKELTAQEKATATLAIIQRDGAAAAGDFARTADGAANKQRILTARLEDQKAALGERLLPAYAAVLGFVTDKFVPGLGKVFDVFDRVAQGARGLYDILVNGDFTAAFANAFNVDESSKLVDWLFDAREAVVRFVDEVKQGMTAAVAAFRDGGDYITSSGLEGFIEQLGVYARDLFDLFRNVGVPAFLAVAGVVRDVASVAIPLLVDGFTGMVRAGVAVINFLKEHETTAKALAAVLGTVMVPALVALGAHWVALQVTAAASAAKQAAAWALTKASALSSAVAHGAHVIAMVGHWVMLGAQSLAQAARVAAAWVVAMGPVGWVIATVVALVALIVANWDTIKRVTGAAWDWVMQKLGAAWDWIKSTVGSALTWVLATIVGKWNDARNWTEQTWNAITSRIGAAWDWIKSTVLGAASWVVDTILDKWNAAKDLTSRTWDGIKNTIGGILGGIKDTIYGAVLWVVDKWSWFALKVIEGADKAFGWVPGLGGKLDEAKRAVTVFREGVNAEMAAIRNKDLKVNVDVQGHYGIDVAAASAKIGFFARGGWTGPGGKYEPAGVVHADEFVVNKESRRRVETQAPGLLDYINRTGSLPGYADGGIVQGLPGAKAEIMRHTRDGANRTVQTAAAAWAKQMAASLKAAATPPGGGGSSSGLLPVMARMRQFVMNTWGVRNIGGYSNRNIAGTNKKSDHAMGKAIDVMVGSNKRLGDSIAAYFTSPAGRAAWPVDNVIWYRRIWNSRRGYWRRYGGVHPHYDHPHIDTFDRGGVARGLGWLPKNVAAPERVLSPEQTQAFERLVAVLDRGSLSAVRSQPVPVEKHLHYHAAVGRSLPEEDFFDAAGRARMLGW